MESEIAKLFVRNKRVSVLELLGAIVVFANLEWTEKVATWFYLFDFDGNLALTKDEFKILVKSFAHGFASITAGGHIPEHHLSALAENIFDSIDRVYVNKILLDE